MHPVDGVNVSDSDETIVFATLVCAAVGRRMLSIRVQLYGLREV
jgi:hypothetical protein